MCVHIVLYRDLFKILCVARIKLKGAINAHKWGEGLERDKLSVGSQEKICLIIPYSGNEQELETFVPGRAT